MVHHYNDRRKLRDRVLCRCINRKKGYYDQISEFSNFSEEQALYVTYGRQFDLNSESRHAFRAYRVLNGKIFYNGKIPASRKRQDEITSVASKSMKHTKAKMSDLIKLLDKQADSVKLYQGFRQHIEPRMLCVKNPFYG